MINMYLNTDNSVSMTEAEQDFTKIARIADSQGSVIITKNGVPRYVLIEYAQAEAESAAADEDVLAVSDRLIEKNREAYEELAK